MLVHKVDGSFFFRFFWAFGPYILSYKAYLRRLIYVPHLKGKYFGTLLVAYAFGAQNHIFLFAFANVDSDNKHSWFCFLV